METKLSESIRIQKTQSPRPRASSAQLGFGKYFADHMLSLVYENGQWQSPRIEPYGAFSLEPGASVFHYGQALFEGMKAFRNQQGQIQLFRPEFHARRMAQGAQRLCMPAVPEDLFINCIRELVRLDADWVPQEKDCALYIRPTLIGTESFLGVRPSEKYLFFIICSPVGPYYPEGFAPVKIWIEEKTVRASAGGLGATKAAANYAASLYASTQAKKKNYSQVLWLDAQERKYVEEVGTMNVFFVIGNEVVTPSLDGSILAGATRDSVIQILRDWNIKVTERRMSLQELSEAHRRSELKEIFGTGTAAVISPVGELSNDRMKLVINQQQPGEITLRLHEELSSIQKGTRPDRHRWIDTV